MARYSGGDGMTKVVFCLTVDDIDEPTVAELDAGSDWSQFIMKDGLSEPADQNNVDVASLSDTFNAQVAGSFGGAIELTVQRDNDDDVVWDEITYGLEGFLVVRGGVPVGSAFTSGDPLRVYPVMWHEPVPANTSGDTVATFTATGPVTRQPSLKAAAAAA
jgi:hypothetical protein